MRSSATASGLAIAVAAASIPAPAVAFPLEDQTGNLGPVVRGTLSSPDAQELRNQASTLGGPAVTGAGGWIILPRIDITGFVTDNALQVSSPRQWDIGTIIAPGIGVTADTNRLQLRFNYAPVMSVYARTSSQNSLSHNLNTTGILTVVPEEVFVDLRAVAGVQPAFGGFGGFGGTGLGLPQAGGQGGSIPNSSLLARGNQIQTVSTSISPYFTRQYGDYGTLRIGGSAQYSSFSNVEGYGTVPFSSTGTNGQSRLSTEQTARFITGEFLGRIQNTTEVLFTQTPTSSTSSLTGQPIASTYSTRQVATNKTAYAVNHWLTVFATLGYENIVYSGGLSRKIKGVVWDVGSTILPNPDSSITISYGTREGSESLRFDARYALTPRTRLAASYSSRVGTQLDNLANQLGQGVVNANGILVNSQTGAPLVLGNNGLATDPGLFRFDTLVVSAQTNLDRDQITFAVTSTQQTSESGSNPAQQTTTGRTISATWSRELRPDLSLNSQFSYTTQSSNSFSGNSRTIGGSIGLNYLMTETLTGRVRYSYFSRQTDSVPSTSTIPSSRLNFSQNVLAVGISKQF